MIREDRLLKQFLEFIQIDSETKNEKAMGEKLLEVLSSMGLECWRDNAGETFGSNGFNVYAKLPGTIQGDAYLLSAHMDTVVPGNGIKPQIKDGVISSDGTTILAGDDKSGICGILEAVQTVLENKLPHRTCELLFSIGEEGGMLGAKAVAVDKLESKRAYVFDSSGDVGKIIVGAPGQVKVSAYVIGRSAHAGIAPEEGISSIQVAAKGIAGMNLLRIDEETTCNIGTLKSEYATNIVPEKTYMFAEVRSRNYDKLMAQAHHMVDCLQAACDEAGATLDAQILTNYISYRIPDDSPVILDMTAAMERLGIKPVLALGGGGSDANVYNQKGIESIVLGTGMTKVHTKNETITIRNLNDTARLVLDLITH